MTPSKKFLLTFVGITVLASFLYCCYFSDKIGPNWRVVTPTPFPAKFKGKKLNFDQVYEARTVSFVGYNYTAGSKPNNNGKTKLILQATSWNGLWTTINHYTLQPDRNSFTRYNCPNSNCLVTTNQSRIKEADAVIFHMLDLPKTFPAYRTANQLWISYISEAPWMLERERIKNYEVLDGIFNWTMSYREDSDLHMKYGFIGKRESPFNTNKNRTPFSEKKSVVWFVSDCTVPSNRNGYAAELSKHIDVDIYGACGTKKCFPSQSSDCYEKVLPNYKFYLSFENSICKDYVTEKYFNALEYDIVPVVYGGADYERIGPPGGFIDAANYPRPKDLAETLLRLAADENEYSAYFEWKANYQSYLHPWTCYLCDKLHGPIVPSVKRHYKKWWIDDAQCKTWNQSKGFVPVNKR